jgi:hypothetical protein
VPTPYPCPMRSTPPECRLPHGSRFGRGADPPGGRGRCRTWGMKSSSNRFHISRDDISLGHAPTANRVPSHPMFVVQRHRTAIGHAEVQFYGFLRRAHFRSPHRPPPRSLHRNTDPVQRHTTRLPVTCIAAPHGPSPAPHLAASRPPALRSAGSPHPLPGHPAAPHARPVDGTTISRR